MKELSMHTDFKKLKKEQNLFRFSINKYKTHIPAYGAKQATMNYGLIVAGPPESAAAESNFVVVLAALLYALISVVGLITVARCAWLRRGGAAGTSRFEGQTSANKGLKKKVL
ncbi:zinc finger protein [Forsythia ovata]|uniref:Zinc finger protein n=1 Tax=Forsythia ovata TaxID=205694 RepID=A0ABD1TAG0_9LAMI